MQTCPAHYTRQLYADAACHTLRIACDPAADLDSRFPAWDLDEDEPVRINGWLFAFEEVAPC